MPKPTLANAEELAVAAAIVAPVARHLCQSGTAARYPVAVVRREGTIVGFANIWPGADKEELSIDLM